MTVLTRVRKIVVVIVSTAAALVGAGSAFASSGPGPLGSDPSGARVVQKSPARSLFGGSGPMAYYYYNARM
ncbi:hypothetical protein ACWCP6_31605 [Streptomyces sp. NPDC002004]